MPTFARVIAPALVSFVGVTPALAQPVPERCEAALQQALREALAAQRSNDPARALETAGRVAALRSTGTLRGFMARQHYSLRQLPEALREARSCVRDLPAQPPTEQRDWYGRYCPALIEELERQGIVAAPEPPPRGGVVGRGSLCPEEPAPAITPAQGYTVASEDLPRVTFLPRVPRRSRAPGLGPSLIAGAGVALAIAGGALHAHAWSSRAESFALCAGRGPECGTIDPVVQEFDHARLSYGLSWGFMIAGSAAIAGGVLWYVLARSSPTRDGPTRASLVWSVLPRTDGALVGLGGRL